MKLGLSARASLLVGVLVLGSSLGVGVVTFHRLDRELVDEFPGWTHAARRTRSDTGGSFTLGLRGDKIAIGFHERAIDPRHPERFLRVILTAPRELIPSSPAGVWTGSLLAALGLVALALGVGFLGPSVRRFVRRIGGEPDHIERIALRVADGDLDLEARTGESGVLVHDPRRSLEGKRALVVDDDLRNTDGYEAIARIRGQEQFKDLPIIALMARTTAEQVARCMEGGANGWVPKPVDGENLLNLLRIWLVDAAAR